MNKITKRQFKKLQDIWAYGVDQEVDGMLDESDEDVGFDDIMESAIDYLARTGVTSDNFTSQSLENVVMALMNPVSSEIAAEKFVEPDPEFHFVLKDVSDDENDLYHLVTNARGAVVMVPWSQEDDDYEFIKEAEAEKWGFDLSKFGKAKEKRI